MITERSLHSAENTPGQRGETQMIRDENDRESPKEPANSGIEEDKSSQKDKKDDWIADLEGEFREIERKWPGSKKLR